MAHDHAVPFITALATGVVAVIAAFFGAPARRKSERQGQDHTDGGRPGTVRKT